jgi:hypothetical protein
MTLIRSVKNSGQSIFNGEMAHMILDVEVVN